MTQSNEPREDRLNELIAEYLRRVDRGEEVDPEHFIAPHPELADSFAQYLRDALLADGLKPSHAGPPEQLSATRDTSCSPAADETIPPSDVLVGQEQATEARQFGRYRLVKLLGQGAMGAVYLAEDPELRRHVALKIPKFRDDQDTAARERCQREARAAATISHPNICQVYDIGEQDGTPFIAMAYIEGKSLSQFVGADCQWPERDVAKLVRKIAVALAEAHVKGVVHRDLKPGNIMLDQRQEPIVMDFGLAGGINQPGEEKLTQTGMPLGTPAYMAPEQAEADFARVGPASDVYSLGVICYELLTAQLPFQGPIAAMIVQIAHDEPRRPSELRPSLDKRIEAICLKMMAKSPEDRYPTAAELAAALRHFLEETATVGKSASHATAEAVELLEAAPADYRSTEAGKRTATSPEPNRAGPGLPILPIAITAVAFALIVLVIVVLLRDASLVGFGQFTVLEGDNPALEIGLKGPTVAKAADAQPRAAEEETVSVEDVPWLQRPKGAPPPLAIAPFDEAQAKQHQKAWAEYLGVPVETTNSIGMKLVLIPPGEFMMGSHRPAEDVVELFLKYRPKLREKLKPKTFQREHPVHRVRITRPFYVGTCEVTVGQFRRFADAKGYKSDAERDVASVLGIDSSTGEFERISDSTWRSPGFPQDDNHPVVTVSWDDAVTFCEWLSNMEKAEYRLAMEAEWEYACRAGTTSRYWHGDDPEMLSEVANFADATSSEALPDWDIVISASDGHVFTAPVRTFRPNPFGLYDVHGNVFEHCADWADRVSYGPSSLDDPVGPAEGSHRVTRGGSWSTGPAGTRSACRMFCTLGPSVGFRVVCRAEASPDPRTAVDSRPAPKPEADGPTPPVPPGWTSLFDGKSFDGWRTVGSQNAWSVENGAMVGKGPGTHQYSVKKYSAFELQLDVKLNTRGNSGIVFHAPDEMHGGAGRLPIGYEVQAVSGENKGKYGYTGSVFQLAAGQMQELQSVTRNPIRDNEWFHLRLRVDENHATVTIDGRSLSDVQLPRRGRRRGHIGLQAWTKETRASFRNVWIKRL